MAAIDIRRPHFATAGLFGKTLAKFTAAYTTWNDSRTTRSALSQLTDRELDDIGLTRGDIETVGLPR